MNTRNMLRNTLRSSSTTLKRIASSTLALPLLAMASLPAVLNAQASLMLLQPQTTVLASGFGNAQAIATDATGNVYVPNSSGGITKITPGGTQSVVAGSAGLNPSSIAVDPAGNLWVIGASSGLTVIAPNGALESVTTTYTTSPTAVAVDGSGNIYVASSYTGTVGKLSGQLSYTGGYWQWCADNQCNLLGPFPQLPFPTIYQGPQSAIAITSNSSGNAYFIDSGTAYEINANNAEVSSVPGLGGSTLAVDGNGDLFSTVPGNSLVPGGLWEIAAGYESGYPILSGVTYNAVAMDPAGYLVVSDGNTNQLLKVSLNSVNFASTSVCPNPNGCGETTTLTYYVNASGSMNPMVSDGRGQTNDFGVTGTNCQSVAAGKTCTVNIKFTPTYAGLRTGALEVMQASGAFAPLTTLSGVGQGPQAAFDGAAPQTLASATESNAVTVDEAGNIYFVTNSEVGFIPVGNPSTYSVLYSGLSQGSAVVVDSAGNVYVADQDGDQGNGDVLKITPNSNTVSTVVTGVLPTSLAVDASGNLYIADPPHNRVVELVAASGAQLTLGTGLSNPTGVALDSSGDLYIADHLNSRVVEIAAGGGAQTTVASGLSDPYFVAVDAAENLIITYLGEIEEIPAGGGSPITLSTGELGYTALDAQGDIFFANDASQVGEIKRSQPPALTFPSTAVGSSSTLSTTMENIGNEPLSAVSPGLNSNSSNYQLQSGSGDCTSTFSLAPATNCSISVNFTPASVGTITGAIFATDNSLNNQRTNQIVNLTGTAVQ
jgi:large repetitive protein